MLLLTGAVLSIDKVRHQPPYITMQWLVCHGAVGAVRRAVRGTKQRQCVSKKAEEKLRTALCVCVCVCMFYSSYVAISMHRYRED